MAFGAKVVGAENYKAAVAKTKGRAGFGHRVTGNTPPLIVAAPSAPAAKPLKATVSPVAQVPIGAPAVQDGLSIEQMRTIIAENPAFIETLHVQELERAEGPRRDALLAIREGAIASGQPEIAEEIDEVMADSAMAPDVKPEVQVINDPETGDKAVVIPTDFTALRALAKEHGVDLVANRSKIDITAALVVALNAKGITAATI